MKHWLTPILSNHLYHRQRLVLDQARRTCLELALEMAMEEPKLQQQRATLFPTTKAR